MKSAVAFIVVFAAFWGLVFWLTHILSPVVLIVAAVLAGMGSLMAWALCRAGGLADEDEQQRALEAKGWADHLDDMDWSQVRHGGLGR